MSEKRLIDANALLTHQVEADRMGAMLVVGKGYILNAPTINAEPVRHGDWVRTSPATWECTVCHAPYRGTPVRPNWSRYCHNCGAKMDAKEDAK